MDQPVQVGQDDQPEDDGQQGDGQVARGLAGHPPVRRRDLLGQRLGQRGHVDGQGVLDVLGQLRLQLAHGHVVHLRQVLNHLADVPGARVVFRRYRRARRYRSRRVCRRRHCCVRVGWSGGAAVTVEQVAFMPSPLAQHVRFSAVLHVAVVS